MEFMAEFRILGPVEVIEDGTRLSVGTPKERALLTMLAANPGRAVSTDRITAGLWGESPPTKPRTTIRTYVSHLRRALGDSARIETVEDGYLLGVEPEEIDAFRFEALVTSGDEALEQQAWNEAVEAYSNALDLWRGTAFAELPDDERARIGRERLEELRLQALEGKITARVALGLESSVVAELEEMVATHPLRERFAELLMTALYRLGRQADALSVYQRTRKRLGEELGIEPGPDLQQLEEAILLQDDSLRPDERPSITAHDIPSPLTTFVGRGEEIARVGRLLTKGRLVTLTGPGGSGKTRLAIEVANGVAGEFDQKPRWVDLDSVTRPILAVQIAKAFGMRSGAKSASAPTNRKSVIEELVASLRGEHALLVLDNCEHLVDEVAAVVGQLLEHTDHLRVLATSREPVRVPGEQTVRVGPLNLPPRDATSEALTRSEAGRLFVDRATDVGAGYALSEPAVVAEICRRLDGLPLALELAASRMSTLGPSDLLKHLDDRFEVLAGGNRSASPRHRTLRKTIEWSYELLPQAEQDIFRRISVFSGPFTLKAAEAITRFDTKEVLEYLPNLVEKSLVRLDRTAPVTRYCLLETIREFGRELLADQGEMDTAFGVHLDHFVRLVERADQGVQTSDQFEWLDALDDHMSNLRQALAWSAENQRSIHFRLVAALGWFWYFRGHVIEGIDWLDSAITDKECPPSLRAKVLNRRAMLAWSQGQTEGVPEWTGQARQLAREAGDATELSIAVVLRGLAAMSELRFEDAGRYLAEGVAKAEEAGNDWAKAWAKMSLGHNLRNLGRYEESNDASAEAKLLFERMGEKRGIAHVNLNLARLSSLRGDPRRGITLAKSALQTLEEADDAFGIGLACSFLAVLFAEQSQRDEAIRYAYCCIEHGVAIGGDWFLSLGLSVLAWVAADENEPRLAVRLYGAAEAISSQPGTNSAEPRWQRRDQLRKELPSDLYEEATEEGMKAQEADYLGWAREVGALAGLNWSALDHPH